MGYLGVSPFFTWEVLSDVSATIFRVMGVVQRRTVCCRAGSVKTYTHHILLFYRLRVRIANTLFRIPEDGRRRSAKMSVRTFHVNNGNSPNYSRTNVPISRLLRSQLRYKLSKTLTYMLSVYIVN